MSKAIGLILNYRDASRTSACIRNLLQEGAAQVLVWDNSEDGMVSSAALSKEFRDETRVSIVDNNQNLGFAAGVNAGLQWIKTRYPEQAVLLINNDAYLLPGGLATLLYGLQHNSSAQIVFPSIDHGGWIRGIVYYHRLTGLIFDRKLPGTFAYASGCCLLINTVQFKQPLFNEDFFMYGEDWELGWQLSKQAGAMVHIPQLLVRHEGSASSGVASEFYESRVVAAHFILMEKIKKNELDKFFIMTFHKLTLLIRALVRSVRYQSKAAIYCLFNGWKIYKNSKINNN